MKNKEPMPDDSYANKQDPERLFKEIMIKEIKERISSRIQNDDPTVTNTLKTLIESSVFDVKKKQIM